MREPYISDELVDQFREILLQPNPSGLSRDRYRRALLAVDAEIRREASEEIAAWSSPSGWVTLQSVVFYLEDGTEPDPSDLNQQPRKKE